MLETHRKALEALWAAPERAKLSAAVAAPHRAERIMVFGIGPSAQLVRYVSVLLNRNGRQAGVLDSTGIALADQLLDLHTSDALLLLAYGRAYREVVATIQEGRRRGLPMVLVTDTLENRLARHADVVIPARRGRAGRVALHATTMVALEALALGLAARDQDRALGALARLDELRRRSAAYVPMSDQSGDGTPARELAGDVDPLVSGTTAPPGLHTRRRGTPRATHSIAGSASCHQLGSGGDIPHWN